MEGTLRYEHAMAGIQLSGLASGFDWKTVVDQLIAIDRTPQDKLRTQKTSNLSKLDAFSTLRSKLSALQDAVTALKSDTGFAKANVSLSDSDLQWTATAANGSDTGQFKFNVSQVATKTVTTGTSNRGAALNDSSDVSALLVSELRLQTAVQAGVFTVNGAQITISDTDTLQDVFAKINTATNGDVTAGYDAVNDRVSLAGSGTITLGSGADTSNLLYALKLYNNSGSTITSASSLGTIDLREAMGSAGLGTNVSGTGSFAINGVTIEYDAGTDTLQSLMARVNESDAGVVMAYDAAGDRFTLTNKNTGDLGLVVGSDTGGLLGALGLTAGATTDRGYNAIFTVNDGATIVSASNSLSSAAHGITGLTVDVTSTGTQTLTVAAATADIKKNITNFVTKFNDVQSYIDSQTKVTNNADGSVTTALMAQNREFTAIASKLRSYVFDSVSGASSSLQRLESIGIDFNGSSTQLAVRDDAKLTSALADDLDGVMKLFTTDTTGVSERLSSYVSSLTNTNGNLDTQENTLERQNTSLDRQIADIDRHLEAERSRLEESFIRMEQAQQQINSQLSALQRTLNL